MKKIKTQFDKFGIYLAASVFGALVLAIAGIFVFYRVYKHEPESAYVDLPKVVSHIDGRTIAMQITLQGKPEDQKWLKSNQTTLFEVYKIELTKIDSPDFHSEEGLDRVRNELKNGMNKSMRTDKINDVLISDVLTRED